jgi:hypothetical protein
MLAEEGGVGLVSTADSTGTSVSSCTRISASITAVDTNSCR